MNANGQKSPRRLLEEFNPIPDSTLQRKIDFFFLPYSPHISCSKHMTFQEDLKQEHIKFIKQMYSSGSLSREEKQFLLSLLSKVEMGTNSILELSESKWEIL